MKRKLISILTAALLMLLFPFQSAMGFDNNFNLKSKNDILQEFKNLSNGNETILIEKDNGIQFFISGILSKEIKASSSSVLQFIESVKPLFELASNKNQFILKDMQIDELGFTHIEFYQSFDGKNVYGKELVAHFNPSGTLIGLTGTLENRIETISKKTAEPITVDEAIEIAKNSKSFQELSEEVVSENYIYYKDNIAYDVYRINIAYDLPTLGSWYIFVDAYSGNIIDEVNLIRDQAVTGSGTAVNGTNRTLNLYLNNRKYYMQDRTKNMTGYISTYTANNRTTTTGTLIYKTTSTINDAAAVSAHSYAEVVYDFYKNMFNRNSLDNSGMSINSVVHYGSRYNNAFWNGYKMVYGDGDGNTFRSLSGDLDVVGHEMTHGVTSYSGNMNYENQPGALNESMSDVLGVLIQTYDKYNVKNTGTWRFNAADWLVGDEIYTPSTPGDALRSLADPTLYSQPAHMSNYQNLPNTQQGDYGGVHINSGIPNKAAYEIASRIGCEKTAKIYYRALTVYFNTTTNFSQARAGFIQSANDLYGINSVEAQAIATGFNLVGIN